MRDRALSREIIDDLVRSVYETALRLAAIRQVPDNTGQQVDLTQILEPFRQSLADFMVDLATQKPAFMQDALNGVGTLAWAGKWRRTAIVEGYGKVRELLNQAFATIEQQRPDVSISELLDILRHKRLVLALGGGGGTGYVHLSLFQWLEELKIQPALITGTSIGSLLGFLRAIQTNYDAALTSLKLPGLLRITRSIRPNLDIGEHGLMGIWRLDFNQIVQGVLQSLGWASTPMFRELKIPFGCVSTGIIARHDIETSVEFQSSSRSLLSRISQLSWRNALKHGAQLASLVTSAQATREIVFGFDELTSTMPVTDAVAFSSLVPGLLQYDVPTNHYRSREIIQTIFKREHLYRLADGGMVSNVPVRAARRAIESGRYGHENIYLLGIDVFAPQARDGIFYPLEQIANSNAIVDAKEADSFVRLKDLLSPFNLAPMIYQLRWLNEKFRKAFEDEMKILEYAMKPLLVISD